MKIKTNGYLEWLLSAIDIKSIKHYHNDNRIHTADSIDHASLYPQSQRKVLLSRHFDMTMGSIVLARKALTNILIH